MENERSLEVGTSSSICFYLFCNASRTRASLGDAQQSMHDAQTQTERTSAVARAAQTASTILAGIGDVARAILTCLGSVSRAILTNFAHVSNAELLPWRYVAIGKERQLGGAVVRLKMGVSRTKNPARATRK